MTETGDTAARRPAGRAGLRAIPATMGWTFDQLQGAARRLPAWVVAAMAVAALATLLAALIPPRHPLSHHMVLHLVAMNLVAPLVAWGLCGLRQPRSVSAVALAAASIAQIGILWAWHVPPIMSAAMRSPVVSGLMMVTLFATATWFWLAIFGQRGRDAWRALVALLATGKLYCLLGIILVFSPRAIYGTGDPAASADDQHLAGLLMVAACPLTYVLAGIVISARWLTALEQGGRRGGMAPKDRAIEASAS